MGKSPEKKCADCGKAVHVRKRECSCGFVFPYKERKKKVVEDYNPQDIDYIYDNLKIVPPRTRNAKCGTCRTKMKGGMLGWHSSFTDGDKYWWCDKCLKDFKDEKYYSLYDKGVQNS